jgi:hypothetical protein
MLKRDIKFHKETDVKHITKVKPAEKNPANSSTAKNVGRSNQPIQHARPCIPTER